MADGEKLLSLRQAHARLAEIGVDVQTIRAWGEKGWLGDVKKTPGRHRRYSPAAIDEALRKWRAGEPLEPTTDDVASKSPPTDG